MLFYKNISFLLLIVSSFFLAACSTHATQKIQKQKLTQPTQQDVRVFTTINKTHSITPTTIGDKFEAVGLSISGNNDMNKIFRKRFGKVYYKTYNLAMFSNNDYTLKLLKKYPNFGALTPLTMSIWEDETNIYVATLSARGMARACNIPLTDKDLIAYTQLIDTALHKALPHGHYKTLSFTTAPVTTTLATEFSAPVKLQKGVAIEEYIEDFEAEFEAELEPLGFLLPNYINLSEEIFEDAGYTAYDFYHTYSICKFDVIFPVSRLHPEAGAWAPCSFYLYKKKGETQMHMGFLSVENWISSLDIHDKASLDALRNAQKMIEAILKEMTE